MASEPICIHRTTTTEEADIIIAWLGDQGVEAFLVDRESFSISAFGSTDIEGVPICVKDEQAAERGKALLEEHAAQRAKASEDEEADDSFTLKCKECGEACTYPASDRGSVKMCESCGGYMDDEDAVTD